MYCSPRIITSICIPRTLCSWLTKSILSSSVSIWLSVFNIPGLAAATAPANLSKNWSQDLCRSTDLLFMVTLQNVPPSRFARSARCISASIRPLHHSATFSLNLKRQRSLGLNAIQTRRRREYPLQEKMSKLTASDKDRKASRTVS